MFAATQVVRCCLRNDINVRAIAGAFLRGLKNGVKYDIIKKRQKQTKQVTYGTENICSDTNAVFYKERSPSRHKNDYADA